jgi:hypothetical protein
MQLSQNTNQDLKMIILLLLPYMDHINNFENYSKITQLKDYSLLKNKENKYITNIQYDRRFFKDDNKPNDSKEYEWSLIDLYNNYIATIHTIYKCANHLYCNWVNIIPLSLDTYSKSNLYKSKKY